MMERTTRNRAASRSGRGRWFLGLWLASGMTAAALLAEAQVFRSPRPGSAGNLPSADALAFSSSGSSALRRPPADRAPRWFGHAPEAPLPEQATAGLQVRRFTPLPPVAPQAEASKHPLAVSPLTDRLIGLPLTPSGTLELGTTDARISSAAKSGKPSKPSASTALGRWETGGENEDTANRFDGNHANENHGFPAGGGPDGVAGNASDVELTPESSFSPVSDDSSRSATDRERDLAATDTTTTERRADSSTVNLPGPVLVAPSAEEERGKGSEKQDASTAVGDLADKPLEQPRVGDDSSAASAPYLSSSALQESSLAADTPASVSAPAAERLLRGADLVRLPSVGTMASETAAAPDAKRPDRVAEGAVAAQRSRIAREMQLVARQAAVHTRRGFAQANRMALFSARAEFIEALSIVAQAADALQQTKLHARALAAGLRALKEADDFVVRGSRLEADMDLATLVAGHRTPVLQNEAGQVDVPTLVARQRYYDYAQQQLALAAAGQPAASMALYGLGRVYAALGAEEHELLRDAMPKALVFHQAALAAQPSNYLAANEIGVLLTHFGRYEEARRALEHSVAVMPQATTYHNLSVVLDRLGDRVAAEHVRRLSVAMRGGRRSGAVAGASQPAVQWVRPETLAAASAGEPVPLAKPREGSSGGSERQVPGASKPSPRGALTRVIPWFAPEEKQTK